MRCLARPRPWGFERGLEQAALIRAGVGLALAGWTGAKGQFSVGKFYLKRGGLFRPRPGCQDMPIAAHDGKAALEGFKVAQCQAGAVDLIKAPGQLGKAAVRGCVQAGVQRAKLFAVTRDVARSAAQKARQGGRKARGPFVKGGMAALGPALGAVGQARFPRLQGIAAPRDQAGQGFRAQAGGAFKGAALFGRGKAQSARKPA